MNYAIQQTFPLRERVEAFYLRERRWPDAAEPGIEGEVSYPAGGGYRLGPEGSIAISFALTPGLKGRSLTFRPKLDSAGTKLEWDCVADPAIRPGFLPHICRP